MPPKKHKNLSIPEALMEEVHQITNDKRYGYPSATQFITDAVRRLLHEFGRPDNKR